MRACLRFVLGVSLAMSISACGSMHEESARPSASQCDIEQRTCPAPTTPSIEVAAANSAPATSRTRQASLTSGSVQHSDRATLTEIVALQRRQLEILERIEVARPSAPAVAAASVVPAPPLQVQPAAGASSSSAAAPSPKPLPAAISSKPMSVAPSVAQSANYGFCVADCQNANGTTVTCIDECACRTACENHAPQQGDAPACKLYCTRRAP